MSSGFGEGMGAGAGLLDSVAAELADSGMRILGPNCEGLASLPADAPLTFSPVLDIDASGTRLRPGSIAVLSQSGGLGFAVAQWGTAAGLDFSYIISTGNEYDLDCLELAGRLVDTPETEIVVMLMESVRDMAEFAAVGERFRQAGKRLVVAKLGTTEPGARGAYAHTRHVAGDIAEYRRLFRDHGIVEAADEEDLIDVRAGDREGAQARHQGPGAGSADRHRHHLGRRRGVAGRRLRSARPDGPRAVRAAAGDDEGAHAAVRLTGQPGRPDRPAHRGRLGRAGARGPGRVGGGRRHHARHVAILVRPP